MRAIAILAPLLAGCLFTGDINERPSVTLHALIQSTTLGQPITLEVDIDDDQDRTQLAVVVRDADGNLVDDPCVVGISDAAIVDEAESEYQVTIWRTGTYTIEATPTDRLGASGSSATVALTVTDAPPVFASPTAQLRPGLAPTACTALYPTGKAIPIALGGGASDPEQTWHPPPLGACPLLQAPAPLVYTWHLLGGPTGSAATLGHATADGSCPDDPSGAAIDLVDPASTICLYADPSLPTGAPSMYQVALDVSDGTTTRRTDTLTVPVIGDAPACLDGTYPQVGAYVLDRDMPTVFQVVGVDDVSAAPTLTFTWSIERPGATTFTTLDAPVSAADGGARYVFDPAALGLAVGDEVRLRAEIADPGETAPVCDADDDRCDAASCAAAPATTCPRRATWSLEVR